MPSLLPYRIVPVLRLFQYCVCLTATAVILLLPNFIQVSADGYPLGCCDTSLIFQQFVIEEIMNECLQTALETYDLVGAEGDGSEAEINTDIQEMLKVF